MDYRFPNERLGDMILPPEERQAILSFILEEFSASITDRRKNERRYQERRRDALHHYSGGERRNGERRNSDRRRNQRDSRVENFSGKFLKLIGNIRSAGRSLET